VWSTIKFSPVLPESLNPLMGMNVKYLAVVKGRFWEQRNQSPNTTTDQGITQTWDATDDVQKGDGPAAIVAFSGGPAAELMHKLPVPDRQPAYAKIFESLYPGFGEQFFKGQFMDWIGDPWTRAGYSFPAPGQVTAHGPILRAGLGRLHFAGEYSCYAFVGYMQGALQSGATLARRIAARDGIVPV
jgi:monoamine oxidase